MNTKAFLDLCMVDNLYVKFHFLIFIIRTKNKVTLARIQFLYNYLKTIQIVLVQISEAYLRSTLRFLSQKRDVLSSAYAAKLPSFCSKNMSNVFILESKDSSMDPWGTPFSIFDHMLKDEFILILCSRPTK